MGLVNSPKAVSPCRGFFFFCGIFFEGDLIDSKIEPYIKVIKLYVLKRVPPLDVAEFGREHEEAFFTGVLVVIAGKAFFLWDDFTGEAVFFNFK